MRDSNDSENSSSQGLAKSGISGNHNIAKIKSRLRSREITERKQVGDAESMLSEPASMQPGSGSEWLEK